MKTSRIGLLGFILFFGSILSYAQPPDETPRDKRKEIEAHKVAFITSQLKLTTEEAQAFWPVYNECQEKRHALRKENRGKYEKKDESGNTLYVRIDHMSDSEVEAMVDERIVGQQRELNMEKECLARYKTVLPIKKVAKLQQTERKFRHQLLKRIKGDRAQQRVEPYQRRP